MFNTSEILSNNSEKLSLLADKGPILYYVPGVGGRVQFSKGAFTLGARAPVPEYDPRWALMWTPLFLSTRASIRARHRCQSTRSRLCTRALKWTPGPCVQVFFVGSEEFYPQSTSSHTHNSLLRYFCKNGVCWRSKVDERQLGYPECGQSLKDKAPCILCSCMGTSALALTVKSP